MSGDNKFFLEGDPGEKYPAKKGKDKRGWKEARDLKRGGGNVGQDTFVERKIPVVVEDEEFKVAAPEDVEQETVASETTVPETLASETLVAGLETAASETVASETLASETLAVPETAVVSEIVAPEIVQKEQGADSQKLSAFEIIKGDIVAPRVEKKLKELLKEGKKISTLMADPEKFINEITDFCISREPVIFNEITENAENGEFKASSLNDNILGKYVELASDELLEKYLDSADVQASGDSPIEQKADQEDLTPAEVSEEVALETAAPETAAPKTTESGNIVPEVIDSKFKDEAVEKIKKIIRPRIENIRKKDKDLSSLEPESFLNDVVNILIHRRGSEKDTFPSYDIFESIARKKQKGERDYIEKEDVEQLVEHAYSAVDELRKQMLKKSKDAEGESPATLETVQDKSADVSGENLEGGKVSESEQENIDFESKAFEEIKKIIIAPRVESRLGRNEELMAAITDFEEFLNKVTRLSIDSNPEIFSGIIESMKKDGKVDFDPETSLLLGQYAYSSVDELKKQMPQEPESDVAPVSDGAEKDEEIVLNSPGDARPVAEENVQTATNSEEDGDLDVIFEKDKKLAKDFVEGIEISKFLEEDEKPAADQEEGSEPGEKLEQEAESLFKQGDRVKVLRTSGEMEDDWIFSAIKDDGDAFVIKFDNEGGTLTKSVPMEDLKKWNFPDLEASEPDQKKEFTGENDDQEIIDSENFNKVLSETEISRKLRETSEPAKENEPNKSEQGEDLREKELRESLEEARNEYAKIRYRERNMMQQLRKFFKPNSQEGETESPNITSAREFYNTKLKEFNEYRFSKLRSSGLEGEELEIEMKKLVTYLNCDEIFAYGDSRYQARMDYLDEKEGKGFFKKNWDKVRFEANKAVEWYDENIPTWAKISIIVATFAPGALVATVGASGAAAFGLTKRTWGAFMMGAAGARKIDKLAHLKDKAANMMDVRNIMKQVKSSEEGEEKIDWDKFGEILNGKTSDVDKKLEKYVKRSKRNKAIATAATIFLGATTTTAILNSLDFDTSHGVGSFLGGIFGHHNSGIGLKETFDKGELPPGASFEGAHITENPNMLPSGLAATEGSGGPSVPAAGVNLPENPSMLSSGLPAAETPGAPDAAAGAHLPENPPVVNYDAAKPVLNDFSSHESSLPENGVQHDFPAVESSLHTETLTVKEGSSIEKTLIDHIKAVHPNDIKDPGHAAHRMFLDYMHDNKDEIIKRVGQDEYYKMIKDGMINVKPGTILTIDEHDKLKLNFVGDKFSHLGSHNIAETQVDHTVNTGTETTAPSGETSAVAGVENPATASEAPAPIDGAPEIAGSASQIPGSGAIETVNQVSISEAPEIARGIPEVNEAISQAPIEGPHNVYGMEFSEDPTGTNESIRMPLEDEILKSPEVQGNDLMHTDGEGNLYLDPTLRHAVGAAGAFAGITAAAGAMNMYDKKRFGEDKKPNDLEAEEGEKKNNEPNGSKAEKVKNKNKKINDLEKVLGKDNSPAKLLQTSLDKITSSMPNKTNFWKKIKDKPFEIENLSKKKKVQKDMLNLVKEFQEITGDEALPKKDPNGKVMETSKEWLYRVMKITLEKNK